jgi:hypothetical protein
MTVDLKVLKNMLSKRGEELEKGVEGSGYLLKTVMGVATFLLDNEGDLDLLSSKQTVTYERFILPLLSPRGGSGKK